MVDVHRKLNKAPTCKVLFLRNCCLWSLPVDKGRISKEFYLDRLNLVPVSTSQLIIHYVTGLVKNRLL